MCLSCQSQPSAGSWLGGTPITADTCANHKVLCNPAERHRRMNRAWQLFSWVVQPSNITHRCRRTFSKCSYEHVSKASVDCRQKPYFLKHLQKHQGHVCLFLYLEQMQVGICQICACSLDVAIGAKASHQTWSHYSRHHYLKSHTLTMSTQPEICDCM